VQRDFLFRSVAVSASPDVNPANQFFGFALASLCLQNEIQQFESFQHRERRRDAKLAKRAKKAVRP
jgi:hypothetical protein